MSKLDIPQKGLDAIYRIGSYDDELLASIAHDLNELPYSTNKKELAESIKSIDFKESMQLISALFAFCNTKTSAGKEIDLFIGDIILTIESNEKEIDRFQKIGFERVRENLSKIMSSERIAALAKAVDIYTDRESVYLDSRVFTDIRPVYDDDGNKLNALLAVHTLKLEFYNDNKKKEFFVNLDDVDLEQLLQKLTKERNKAKTLSELLTDKQLNLIKT